MKKSGPDKKASFVVQWNFISLRTQPNTYIHTHIQTYLKTRKKEKKIVKRGKAGASEVA